MRPNDCPRGALSKHCGSGGEDLLALLAQQAQWPDVPVERHGCDPELSAEFGHGGVAAGHRGLASRTDAFDSANFLPPLRPRGLEPGQGAFADQLPFGLGQRPFLRARKQPSSPGRSSRTPEAKSW